MVTANTDRYRAMGSTVDIAIHGDPALLELAHRRIDELERKWSRFLPDSEVSRCNETRGIPVFVSADTRTLVRHGIRAWWRTGGACDPSVLDALVAAGYDRPFDQILTDSTGGETAAPAAAPGCAGIEVDDHQGSVTLPARTGFDPGAIGKGLAADIVATELMDAGAIGAFVSIGGDLRAAGAPASGDGWLVSIEEPSVAAGALGSISLTEGAVATSTDQKRRWTRSDEEQHHIIDPSSGAPSVGDTALVTTIAGAAWWAEALATQLMLTPQPEWPRVVGTDGALIVDTDGEIHVLGRMKEHLR